MVYTLRITSILAAALAIAVVSFGAVYGFRPDGQVDELLEGPTVIESIQATLGTDPQPSRVQDSPLVAQARLFALHLNPPPRVAPTVPVRAGKRPVPVQVQPTRPPAKFQVIGISYNTDPNLSRALIDEGGDSRRWVRLHDEIAGHRVQAIGTRAITLSNGQEEPLVERQRVSLVVNAGQEHSTASAAAAGGPVTTAAAVRPGARYTAPRPTSSRLPASRRVSVTPRPAPGTTASAQADAKEIAEIVQQLQRLNQRGELSEADEQARQAIMRRLTEIQAQRLKQRETESLTRFGRRLDPNRAATPSR